MQVRQLGVLRLHEEEGESRVATFYATREDRIYRVNRNELLVSKRRAEK